MFAFKLLLGSVSVLGAVGASVGVLYKTNPSLFIHEKKLVLEDEGVTIIHKEEQVTPPTVKCHNNLVQQGHHEWSYNAEWFDQNPTVLTGSIIPLKMGGLNKLAPTVKSVCSIFSLSGCLTKK